MMKTFLYLFPPILTMMCCCSTTPAKFPDGPKVEAREIVRQLQAGHHVFLEGKEIAGDLDFTALEGAYPEGADIWRTEVAGSVTFQKCTFKGRVGAFRKDGKKVHQATFLRNLTFMDCTFDKAVELRMANVRGDSRWQNSVFRDSFLITGAVFGQSTNFQNASFTGPFYAQDAVFYGKTHFLDAAFEGVTSFQAAQFHQDAQFGATRFLAYVEFNQVWAQQGFFFSYAQFFDRAYFRNARFDDRTEFFKAEFQKEASFANSRFNGPAKFSEAVISGSLSFEKCLFQTRPAGWYGLGQLPPGTVNLKEASIRE